MGAGAKDCAFSVQRALRSGGGCGGLFAVGLHLTSGLSLSYSSPGPGEQKPGDGCESHRPLLNYFEFFFLNFFGFFF